MGLKSVILKKFQIVWLKLASFLRIHIQKKKDENYTPTRVHLNWVLHYVACSS